MASITKQAKPVDPYGRESLFERDHLPRRSLFEVAQYGRDAIAAFRNGACHAFPGPLTLRILRERLRSGAGEYQPLTMEIVFDDGVSVPERYLHALRLGFEVQEWASARDHARRLREIQADRDIN